MIHSPLLRNEVLGFFFSKIALFLGAIKALDKPLSFPLTVLSLLYDLKNAMSPE